MSRTGAPVAPTAPAFRGAVHGATSPDDSVDGCVDESDNLTVGNKLCAKTK